MAVMSKARPHVVMIPLPLQGHIRPLMQLALRLNRVYGFQVTFIVTSYIYKRLGLSDDKKIEDGLHFVDLQEGFPDSHYTITGIRPMFSAYLDMGPVIKELIEKIQLQSSPVTGVIADLFIHAAHKTAISMGIPSVGFSTTPASVLSAQYFSQQFVEEGLLPLPPPPENAVRVMQSVRTASDKSDEEKAALAKIVNVPGMYPLMQLGELYSAILTYDLSSSFFHFISVELTKSYRERAWTLVNTFHEAEGSIIEGLQQHSGVKFTAIGPLVIAPSTQEGSVEFNVKQSSRSSFWPEEMECMEWLDKQKPLSVIYISFGSLIYMTKDIFHEFLLGLEDSQVPFLFVLRADFVNDLPPDEVHNQLPPGFEERTKDQARFVKWAPQLKVLSHPATAGFITHCGWNSVMESLCMGVPMLGYPYFADQNSINRYIISVWKTGLEFERRADSSIPRYEVAKKVKDLAAKESSVRTAALQWKEAAKNSVEEGGSSNNNIEAFVADMYERAQAPTFLRSL